MASIPEDLETFILVTGIFDLDAASRLRQTLTPRRCSQDAIVVDFSRAREVTATALAALLALVRDTPAPIRIRGLTRHHERLLTRLAASASDALPV